MRLPLSCLLVLIYIGMCLQSSDESPFNLTVYATGHSTKAKLNVAAGTCVSSFTQAKFAAKAAWPVLRWDDTETVCARLVTGGVEVVEGDLGVGGAAAADSKEAPAAGGAAAAAAGGSKRKVLGKITAEGIQHFSIAPKRSPALFATFVPARKVLRFPSSLLHMSYPHISFALPSSIPMRSARGTGHSCKSEHLGVPEPERRHRQQISVHR
jgi:hypothetical protein